MTSERRDGEAWLVLADGRAFRGESCGAPGTAIGEAVFTTSMSGYQEVLSDPSYSGQLVTMTSAEIGNVGANRADFESGRVCAAGLIVRSSRPLTSSWRAEGSLRQLLIAQGVVAVEGIDTRALVLHLREHGAQMGVLTSEPASIEALTQRARAAGTMVGQDLARTVTCAEPYDFTQGPSPLQALDFGAPRARSPVVVYDFGVKESILRRLVEVGAEPRVVPATTSAEDVLALRPRGVVLSNGPGDPEPCTYAIEAARKLTGRVPVLGICLGHQILGLAYGARSFKLKFGHRGSNQPVRHEPSGRIMITAQNHGFAIDPDSLKSSKAAVTEINLNDHTLEGFEVPSDRVLAVQYHPEASPGPHDASDHFRRFAALCAEA
ncbi:MAG: glutamine-hydrolyzing carbamoyl-phosphate synthase small subunit [Deltaproteobacteria bacterium]|nr:glutamine-hydrolyzing carbamoyl-phosphate synthase small subunit [Deltaproteobacteria bacterium]